MNRRIKNLAIIGVGLIGGSLARALRRVDAVEHITGAGRNPEHLQRARKLGVVDDITTCISAAVKDADIVLISTPVCAYDALFAEMAGSLPPHCLITDAGSVKQHAIDAARKQLSAGQITRFVPAHPIAGTEHSGVDASFAELFDTHLCILTPEPETSPEATQAIEAMWQTAGSHVICMDAADHDDFLAAVSHLPHMLAYALVNAVRKQGNETHDPFCFAAGGFRDFTRIASSSPEMWRDIALCNRTSLLHKLDALQTEVDDIRTALEAGDGERLLVAFRQAKRARDEWLAGREGSRE